MRPGCCSAIISYLTLLVLIFSLGFPWYFTAVRTSTTSDGSCDVLYLVSWESVYCRSRGGGCDGIYAEDGVLPCPYDNENWRKHPEILTMLGLVSDNTPAKTVQLYNYVGILLAYATGTSLLIAVGITVVCVRQRPGPKICKCIYLIVGLSGLAALTVIIIGFAIEHPKVLTTDGCVDDPSIGGGPCDKFWGKYTVPAPGGTRSDEYDWGGAGWIVAIIGWPLLLSSAITACKARPE